MLPSVSFMYTSQPTPGIAFFGTTTIPPAHTVQVPGGRQALARSELVMIEVGAARGEIPRPNLVGAILLKARAVETGRPAVHRGDLALLLSLVTEPERLGASLSRSEERWIRRRDEMSDLAERADRRHGHRIVSVGRIHLTQVDLLQKC